MNKWLQGGRYTRLARDLKKAWRSFRYDVVLPKGKDWIHEAADRAADEINLRHEIVKWTNFPAGRGFEVGNNGWQWKAWDDKGNLYWLNTSAKRWICMEGPDSNLPKDDYGNVNQGQNFTHDGQGYFVFKTPEEDTFTQQDDFFADGGDITTDFMAKES